MFISLILSIAISLSSIIGIQPAINGPVKPMRSIVDTGNGGGESFSDFNKVCGSTPNGSAQCWGRWGA